MKNLKGLKVSTKFNRNYFIWSLCGIVSFTIWFYLLYTQQQVKLKRLVTDLAVECIVIGMIGLLLVLSSCCRYCLRLGIVPGIYHSTLCIPHWDSGSISFLVSDGLYFSLFSGLLFFVSYGTVVYSLFVLGNGYVFAFQVQTYAAGVIGMFNYFRDVKMKKEVLGILVVLGASNGVYGYSSESVQLEHLGIGGLLVGINLACVISVMHANNFIDTHSTAILTAIVQGCFGTALFILLYFSTILQFELLSLFKGAIFSLFLYCFTQCSLTESSLLLLYPCFCTLFIGFFSLAWLLTLLGALCGTLIILFGDIPHLLYHHFKPLITKSPLHSPLLI